MQTQNHVDLIAIVGSFNDGMLFVKNQIAMAKTIDPRKGNIFHLNPCRPQKLTTESAGPRRIATVVREPIRKPCRQEFFSEDHWPTHWPQVA